MSGFADIRNEGAGALEAVGAAVQRAVISACLCAVLGGLARPAAPAGAATGLPYQATGGTIGIRLLQAPVNRRDDPRARMYVVDYLPPGAVIQRMLEVVNTSRQRQHVELYAAAASITDDHFVGAADRTANELSTWVRLSAPSQDIPAGAHADIEATIAVPATAPSGERYAVIWAQVSSPPGGPGAIQVVNRVGVRLYLDVGVGGEPASDFAILALTAARNSDGTPEVLARVHNTGARALDLTGSLTLSDGPGTMSAGPFRADPGLTLGIGDYGQIVVSLDTRLPAGPWSARLTLASGQVQHTTQATLTFPHNPGVSTAAPAHANTAQRYLIALLVLGGLLSALLLVAGALAWRRRRRLHSPPPRTPQPAPDPGGGK